MNDKNDFNKLREEFINSFCDSEDQILADLRRETTIKCLHPRMLSGWYQGSLLNFLVKISKAENVLEIGTYTGYSTICMARALPKSGKLTSIEKNDELENIIKKYISLAGLNTKINLVIDDALEYLSNYKSGKKFDMVFIDADKREYVNYLKLALNIIKDDAFIVVDNVLWDNKIFFEPESNDYMTKGVIEFNNFVKNEKSLQKIILPLRDGLMLLRKKQI